MRDNPVKGIKRMFHSVREVTIENARLRKHLEGNEDFNDRYDHFRELLGRSSSIVDGLKGESDKEVYLEYLSLAMVVSDLDVYPSASGV